MSIKRVRDMPIGSYFVVSSDIEPLGMSIIRLGEFDFVEHTDYVNLGLLEEYEHFSASNVYPFLDKEVLDWFEEERLIPMIYTNPRSIRQECTCPTLFSGHWPGCSWNGNDP